MLGIVPSLLVLFVDIVEILKAASPFLEALVGALGGYALASLRSRTTYRDTQMQFIRDGQKEIMDLYNKQIATLDELFDDERERLKAEITDLKAKVARLEKGLDDLADSVTEERRKADAKVLEAKEANAQDRALLAQIRNELAEARQRINKLEDEKISLEKRTNQDEIVIAQLRQEIEALKVK